MLVCRVKEITDFGLLLENEEISNKEVFLHVSEIPREKRLDDFKSGQIVVVRVTKIGKTGERIFVSLKQMNKVEERSVLRRWRTEKKVLEIFNEVAIKYSIPSEVLKDTERKLVERYGSLTEALRMAIMEGENTLARTKLSNEAREAIYDMATKELIRKRARKTILVRLYFTDKYGLNKLKNLFEAIEKMTTKQVTIETRVVAAPRYSIIISSHEPKRLKKVSEDIMTKLDEMSKEGRVVLKVLEEKA